MKGKGRKLPAAPEPREAAEDRPVIVGPGSKLRRGEVPLDDVRTMLLDRIRERGVSIADISRALGKNGAYMHQFIWRSSPRWLGEVDRAVVCRLLDIPEDVLKPPMPGAMRSVSGRLPARSVPDGTDLRDVPMYREGDLIDPAATREWAFRVPGLPPGPLFAVWIAMDHARFGPGDLVYVHQRQPPRPGDYVVAIVEQKIMAIGKLLGIDPDGVRQVRDAAGQMIEILVDINTYKIGASIYA